MEGNRTYNSVNNVIWGFLNKIILIFWPYVIRSAMISHMGVEYLGLSSLFTSLLQMLSLAELGFGSAMVYAMYKPIAENDVKKVGALLSFYRLIYRCIGIFITIIGLVLLPFLPKLINGSCPSDVNLYVLYLIYLSNTVLSYLLFAYRTSLLTAYNRNSVSSIINGVVHTIMYALQTFLIIFFENYYAYIITLPVCTVISNVAVAYSTRIMYPKIECNGKIEKSEMKEIMHRVGALAGHKLGGIITNSTDNVIISSFLGLSTLAIYNNYYQIIASLISCFSILNTSFLGALGNCVVVESKKKNFELLQSLTLVNVWLVGWFSVCLLCLYQPFMLLWVGSEYLLPFEMVVLMVAYFFVWKFKDILALYKDAAGMWNNDKYRPYVYCAVNLITSIYLVSCMGLRGVILGTIISQLLVAIPWETKVFFQGFIYKDPKLKGTMKKYATQMILYSIIVMICCVLTYFLCLMVKIGGIIGLGLKLLICILIPNVCFSITFTRFSGWKHIQIKVLSFFAKRKYASK